MSKAPWEHERELEYRKYVLWFVYACAIYSIIGFSWGAVVGSIPSIRDFIRQTPHGDLIMLAHGHINLLGWVEMAIFAALYYIVPRLVERPIYSFPLVRVHFWMHNFGLIGMVVFFVAAGVAGGTLEPDVAHGTVRSLVITVGLFGFIVLLANCIWAYNIYKTSAGWGKSNA